MFTTWRSGRDALCKSCMKREAKTGDWVFKGFLGEGGGVFESSESLLRRWY